MSTIQIIGIGIATGILIILIIALVVTRKADRRREAGKGSDDFATDSDESSVLAGRPRNELNSWGADETAAPHGHEDATVPRPDDHATDEHAEASVSSPVGDAPLAAGAAASASPTADTLWGTSATTPETRLPATPDVPWLSEMPSADHPAPGAASREVASALSESPPTMASPAHVEPVDQLAAEGAEQPAAEAPQQPAAEGAEQPAAEGAEQPASLGFGDSEKTADVGTTQAAVSEVAAAPPHEAPADAELEAEAAASDLPPSETPRLVPLCEVISTTNEQQIDLNDPEVRRMLRDLLDQDIDAAQQYKRVGQDVDAVLQLTEAQHICKALGMKSHERLIERMIAELRP